MKRKHFLVDLYRMEFQDNNATTLKKLIEMDNNNLLYDYCISRIHDEEIIYNFTKLFDNTIVTKKLIEFYKNQGKLHLFNNKIKNKKIIDSITNIEYNRNIEYNKNIEYIENIYELIKHDVQFENLCNVLLDKLEYKQNVSNSNISNSKVSNYYFNIFKKIIQLSNNNLSNVIDLYDFCKNVHHYFLHQDRKGRINIEKIILCFIENQIDILYFNPELFDQNFYQLLFYNLRFSYSISHPEIFINVLKNNNNLLLKILYYTKLDFKDLQFTLHSFFDSFDNLENYKNIILFISNFLTYKSKNNEVINRLLGQKNSFEKIQNIINTSAKIETFLILQTRFPDEIVRKIMK